jgi:hypothetical protein
MPHNQASLLATLSEDLISGLVVFLVALIAKHESSWTMAGCTYFLSRR